jgi:hypothetical protein
MNSLSALARSRPQRGWFRRRYRTSSSLTAFDRQFSGPLCKPDRISIGRTCPIDRSQLQDNHPQRHLPLRVVLCQAFNTHTAGIVERFSPIRF